MHQPAVISPRQRVGFRQGAVVIAVAASVLLAACSHKHTDKTQPAPTAASSSGSATANAGSNTDTSGLATGGPSRANSGQQMFVTQNNQSNTDTPAPMANGQFLPPNPRISGQGAPALATVPTKAPTPKSTKQDRDKITEGLLSDMNRARYTDSGGRTMPVAVRPLTEAQAQINDAPAIPPKPPAAPAGAVTRLGEPPPPGAQAQAGGTHEPTEPSDSAKASVEAAAKLAANEPAPKLPAMEGPMPSNLPVARTDGFHPLGAYASTTSQSNQVASIEFVGPGTTLTAVQRRALADAAQLGQRTKGSFRVIGRTTQASNLVEERATSVAQELQRLGVAQDRIYVGTDVGTDGHVDVILDQ